MEATARVRAYLEQQGTTPNRLGPSLAPPISGQSIRDVLAGKPVGRKVAAALAKRIAGVTEADLILPKRGKRRGRAA